MDKVKVAMVMEPNPCPGCGIVLTAVSPTRGVKGPEEGSLNICLKCGFLSIFGEGMALRPLTREEFESIPQDIKEEVMIVQVAQQVFRAERNGKMN